MPESTLFKRYSNRRLYNTRTSAYVTIDGVTDVIRKGERVEVVDAKTNEDLTAYILTQILLEEARKKNFLLPSPLLHLVIRFGDGALSGFFDRYLLDMVKNYLSFQNLFGEQFRQWMGVGFNVPEPGKRGADDANPLLTYLESLLATPDRKGRNER